MFHDLKVGILHGKMKPKEKETVMVDFAEGAIQVLVATTVVEVGVDVLNISESPFPQLPNGART